MCVVWPLGVRIDSHAQLSHCQHTLCIGPLRNSPDQETTGPLHAACKMAPDDECTDYLKELAIIVNTSLQKPELGDLQSSLHRWSKAMMSLVENSSGTDEFLPSPSNGLQLGTPWRMLMQKVPETLASLTDLVKSDRLHEYPTAAISNLKDRVNYYTLAAELLASNIER